MGKYSNVETIVYDVFNSVQWKSENIPTYPSNFNRPDGLNTYIRLNILTGGINLNTFPKSSSGQMIIDIFTPAGNGTALQNSIADTLDSYLAGKTLIGNGSMQLSTSSLVDLGTDTVDPSLNRLKYSISFSYYGV